MKFHKLGLTTAAAVLASIVSAGAYTQPAPQIATAIGSGVDGFSLYIGGELSQLGGSVENSQSVMSSTTISNGATAQAAVTSANANSTFTALGVYGAGSNAAITQSEVLTVTGLKFGGEGHLGAYFGVAEGFGVGIEAFGVTRTSFNPISSTTILSNDLIGSTTALTQANASVPTSSVEPSADAYTLGVNIKPNSLGYGVRMMPTVMISDQFGMYVSVGYGSQKVQGTLTNTAFSYVANQYYAAATSGTSTGTASLTNGTLSKNLSGINYGMGSFFNVDETISISSGLEVQKFNTYDVSDLNTGTKAPVAAGASTGVTGVTTIAQASTTVPSTLKVQLNTYSVGIDYAFV